MRSVGWRSGKDIAIAGGRLGFDSLADQIGHSVANNSPPLQRFFCAAQAQTRGDGPHKLVTCFAYYGEYNKELFFCAFFELTANRTTVS